MSWHAGAAMLQGLGQPGRLGIGNIAQLSTKAENTADQGLRQCRNSLTLDSKGNLIVTWIGTATEVKNTDVNLVPAAEIGGVGAVGT